MAIALPTVYSAGAGAFGLPMPAQTTVKQERITWRDWQPPGTPDPDELMTREEFVARLNDLAVDVAESDLRYWEGLGILPRGIRKRRNKVTRVYYPRWLMASVELLRTLQGFGWSLQDIAPRLRATAAEAVQVANETAGKPLRSGRPGRPSVSTRGDVVLLNWARKPAEEALLVKLARRYHADVVRVSFFALRDGEERLVFQQEIRSVEC
jgi:DNA-binding transcriptional MerR regulator